MYIHELQDWPRFHWDQGKLAESMASVRHRQGRLIGHMEALGFNLRQEAVLQTLTGDVVKSSEIEGEKLDAEQVRSSIARRLGLDIGALKPADRHVEGIVEMMLDATQNFAACERRRRDRQCVIVHWSSKAGGITICRMCGGGLSLGTQRYLRFDESIVRPRRGLIERSSGLPHATAEAAPSTASAVSSTGLVPSTGTIGKGASEPLA